MTELHGFTHDEYVTYHDRLIAAISLATVGVLVAALGFSVSSDALVVREAAGWFTADADGARLFGGTMVSALGIMLVSLAPQQYQRATHIRKAARHRYTAATAVTTVVAGIVAEGLQQKRAAEAEA